ncbi:MAG TPA: excinuclease ABC subunit C [Spirochaetia bacterium]|nr:excinuclease ABC subunit C [Spirochaetia bacterium]
MKDKSKLSLLPDSAGVYLMKDSAGKIIYIGKAKNLKNRVRSYFTGKDLYLKTEALVSRIEDLDIIVTNNEKEAFILENNLIKQHQPFYNINLKDNKTYPYIKVTLEEEYPRIIKTREYKKDGLYFGPYPDAGAAALCLEIIDWYFPLKKCQGRRFGSGKRCLNFHLKKCLGPCQGISPREYRRYVDDAVLFLKGEHQKLIPQLEERLQEKKKARDYESAMVLRDQIAAVKKLDENQRVEIFNKKSFDAAGYFYNGSSVILAVLLFRSGRLAGKNSFEIPVTRFAGSPQAAAEAEENADPDFLTDILLRYYDTHVYPVEEIIVSFAAGNILDEMLSDIFTARGFQVPVISRPAKGARRDILELADHNARLSFYEARHTAEKQNALKEMKNLLKLPSLPAVIECFDIANTADKAVIAGMTSFKDGKKNPAEYRIFNIKNASGQNDFAAVEEAVLRRYRRKLAEGKMPDLIIIDGGRGQLNSAMKSLAELGINKQPLIALAKENEEIFIPRLTEPLRFPLENSAMQMLMQIRDETHRFTNSRHIRARDQISVHSVLYSIPGIGKQKVRMLYKKFKSLNGIRDARSEEIRSLPFFSSSDAERLKEFFKGVKDSGRGDLNS